MLVGASPAVADTMLNDLSDIEDDPVDQLSAGMENQTIMSHTDEEQIKMFFTNLKSKKLFRLAFMNLPDDLQRKVLMLPNGQLSLGGYTLNNMDNKDFVDPVSIELPERRPKFDVEDYTEFYEKVSQLSDYDLMVSWLVKYINQYFCVVVEGNEIIEFVYGEVQNPMISFTPQMEEEKQKIKWALSYTSRKAADMKLRFRKCKFYAENGKKANLYDAWSSSKESREYEKKVFDPMRTIAYDDKHILNTFAGLKAEQEVVLDQNNVSMHVHEEDFAPILYHIKNLCGGNDMYYEYLLDWLAYPIQTGEKTNVAVISHGGQG